MNKPKLIVMAAGLGSRYGGLKQMEPITSEGEILLDFSVYDAMKAGFKDVFFIIKPEMEELFRKKVVDPIAKYMNVSCVFQDLNQVPEGYAVPEGRTKPWGTGHAVLACAERIKGPFAVINADDYYGADAFQKVFQFLSEKKKENNFCMAGYYVENTLSEQGTVTRGICETDEHGNLTDIKETREIGWNGMKITYPDLNGHPVEVKKGTVVSMNFWGFQPSMMQTMKEDFPTFLDKALKENPLKEEFLLPNEVGKLLGEGKIQVKVLEAKDRWYGMTYKEDKSLVAKALQNMKDAGKYPEKLWP